MPSYLPLAVLVLLPVLFIGPVGLAAVFTVWREWLDGAVGIKNFDHMASAPSGKECDVGRLWL